MNTDISLKELIERKFLGQKLFIYLVRGKCWVNNGRHKVMFAESLGSKYNLPSEKCQKYLR